VYYEKGSDDTKLLAGTASGTSYTHTGLDANTTYYYYIKAVNSAGESGYSSFSSAKTPSSSGGGDGGGTTTKPSAPSGVSATAQSSSSIKVTWNTVSGAASYKVYYEKGSDDTKMLADTASGTSYTHTGLDANTTYYYYIKAVNSAGESDYSSYSSASSAKTPSSSGGGGGSTTKPSAPTGVKATVQSPNSIQITWNAVSGADTYYVYSAKSSSGSKTLLTPFGISNTTFTDTQLTASTTYYYWVKAENSADESGYSSSASATTATLLPNTPYGSPQVKSPTKNSLTIQWNGSLSATSYKLYRSTSYSGPFTAAVYTGSSTSYTDTGLSAGTTYYYKVTAVNSAGESDFSEVAQGTTTN
jgi:fibronectin type 3 domain-containing protein